MLQQQGCKQCGPHAEIRFEQPTEGVIEINQATLGAIGKHPQRSDDG